MPILDDYLVHRWGIGFQTFLFITCISHATITRWFEKLEFKYQQRKKGYSSLDTDEKKSNEFSSDAPTVAIF
jgi:hypothetical protein